MDRQLIDMASGKDTVQPEPNALLSFVREGDRVVVYSVDRLTRNFDDLRHLVQHLIKRGIRNKSLEFSLLPCCQALCRS